MTLARKMALTTSALVISLLVIAVTAMWGLVGLSRDLDRALADYALLREVYDIGQRVGIARTLLNAGLERDPQFDTEMNRAMTQLQLLLAPRDDRGRETFELTETQQNAASGALASMRELKFMIDSKPGTIDEHLSAATRALNQLGVLATEVRQSIYATQQAAEAKRQTAIGVVALVASIVVLGATLLSSWQYRSVMGPLTRLRRGVRDIAKGQFTDRVPETGDREFTQLAGDFNRMAGELESLYQNLEQKVKDTSRELVRSERLASVGFLAAGVAHEINNPLGIMAGHAELARRKIKRGRTDAAFDEAEHALKIVEEESYRCKEIIQKLLSLARPGGESREPVDLAVVARDVTELVSGLRRYREHGVELSISPDALGGDTVVLGNAGELKQALLNLTLNALDAVEPPHGQVWIEVEAVAGNVRLTVRDNGRGMTQDVLNHIFEPFFTTRKGADSRPSFGGTGLGLSITHAIVQAHQGRIVAQSGGPDRGSRFTIEIPAAAVPAAQQKEAIGDG